MTPGIHRGLSNEAYQASAGLSSTQLRRLLKSPMHYQRMLGAQASGVPAKSSAAMLNGTLVHCALLEPAEFDKRYAVGPDISKNSNAWKDYAKACAEAGLAIIDADSKARAFEQAKSLRALPDVAELLGDGAPELSAYWHEDNVLCRCRPDWVTPVAHGAQSLLLDVKTTADASPEGFAISAWKFGYHIQQAHYCEGWQVASGKPVAGMLFAVVESEFPFVAMTYVLSDAFAVMGLRQRARAMALYSACSAANEWPGYGSGVLTLHPPAWALKAEA